MIGMIPIIYFYLEHETKISNAKTKKIIPALKKNKAPFTTINLNHPTKLLSKEQAFQLQAPNMTEKKITLQWQIAPGYYLYRHGFKILQKNNQPIVNLQLPKGQNKYDEYLGNFQVYEDTVTASFPTSTITLPTVITAYYQGCAESGYCYPPMQKKITLNPAP